MGRFVWKCMFFLLGVTGVLAGIALAVPYNEDGFLREYFVKERMLAEPDRSPAVVLLGGSNVAFGFHSAELSARLRCPVINAGLHAGLGLKFIVDEAFPHLRPGDVLVFSPEYGHFFHHTAYGGQALADVFWLGRGRFLTELNLQQWRALADNTPRFLRSKVEYFLVSRLLPSKENLYRQSAFNAYGDVEAHWGRPHRPFHVVPQPEDLPELNAPFCTWLLSRLAGLEARGVKVILLPPAMAASGYANERGSIGRVEEMFRSGGFPFVCPPSVMAYPDSLFYDTQYHLDGEGALRHSRDLAGYISLPIFTGVE